MPSTLSVGEVSAAPGELKWGYATWAELRDNTRVHLPVMIMNGGSDGPTVTINGATHPTEHIGVHALQILLRQKLNPSKLRGRIIAFPIANPFAQQFSAYVSPHDGINMSRTYPGSKDGTVTQRFANFIWEEAAKKSDMIIDQHENAKEALYFSLVPRAKNGDLEKKTLELAGAFGVTVIRSGGDENMPAVYAAAGGESLSTAAMRAGIPAFTPEYETTTDISFSEKDLGIRVALRGLTNVLKKLGILSGEIEKQNETKVMDGNYVSWGMNTCTRGGLTRRLVHTGVKLAKGTPIS
ncbi:MAG TPA: succinylglutamate desuccinylase/aspartoacylase family protein, partial [Nitrososphaerales archaeon]|nr:succinylglutamate desuccinylase/aspartoacylase family protein [Nitrososphaerales archaeon]